MTSRDVAPASNSSTDDATARSCTNTQGLLHLGEQWRWPPPTAEHGDTDDAIAVERDVMRLVARPRLAVLHPAELEAHELAVGERRALEGVEPAGVLEPGAELLAHALLAEQPEPPVRDGGVEEHVRGEDVIGRARSRLDGVEVRV